MHDTIIKMSYKSEIGKLGEDIACRYLVDNRFQVIQRNFRQKWGEIDIIAKSPDKTLVFIEVKTLFKGNYQTKEAIALSTDDTIRQVNQLPYKLEIGQTNTTNDWKPEDQMTFQKIKKLKRTASLYAGKKQELVDDKKGWRLDLVALTIFDAFVSLNHYENVL